MAHQPFPDIGTAEPAARQDAPVSVAPGWRAGDVPAADEIGQRKGGAATTGPWLAINELAGLIAFRSIDGDEADTLSGELQRIAVDDSRLPD